MLRASSINLISADHDQPGHRHILFRASRGGIEADQCEAGRFERRARMGRAMSIAQRVAQHDAITVMSLDAEGDHSRRRKHGGGRFEHRREIVEIHEDIGGDDEMISHIRRGFRAEEAHDIALGQPVIEALGARFAATASAPAKKMVKVTCQPLQIAACSTAIMAAAPAIRAQPQNEVANKASIPAHIRHRGRTTFHTSLSPPMLRCRNTG